jgi:hypothetical protein
MAIKKAAQAIGESRQRKAASASKRATYNSMKKNERARKSLRKKTWGF